MSRVPPLSKLQMGCNHPRSFQEQQQQQQQWSFRDLSQTGSQYYNSTKKDVCQRRRQNRYDYVQPVVESGMTVQLAKYMKQSTVKTRRQPGQLFKRVRASVIAQYLSTSRMPQQLDDGGFAQPMDQYRMSLQEKQASDSWVDYLLLDCRDVQEYSMCHIKTAINYPRIKLNHATNPFLQQMVVYKNKQNKVIVLYDLEEERVVQFANALCQRGFDNVAIIAGGLKQFVQQYSDEIVGVCTIPIIPKDNRMQRRVEETTNSMIARSETIKSVHKPKSLSNSLAKPRVRAFIPASYYSSNNLRK